MPAAARVVVGVETLAVKLPLPTQLSCSTQPPRIGLIRLVPAGSPFGFNTSQSPIQKSNWRCSALEQGGAFAGAAGAGGGGVVWAKYLHAERHREKVESWGPFPIVFSTDLVRGCTYDHREP